MEIERSDDILGRTAVVVLGDVGRSPRMQYHSVSLSKINGMQVDLIGYSGSECIKEVVDNPHLTRHLIDPPRVPFPFNSFFLFRAIYKVLAQFFVFLWTLMFTIEAPDFILVQNPPAVPILFIVKLVCLFRGSKMVIDWHNFGYTILGLELGNGHPFVLFYKYFEWFFGKRADYHFCVTYAMKRELETNWGIDDARVLYDKPPDFFKEATVAEKHRLFSELKKELSEVEGLSKAQGNVKDKTKTLFTINNKLKEDRPALLVSSTSWTKDEDFSILLEAIEKYCTKVEKAEKNGEKYPDVVLMITGKGPEKEKYEKEENN
eukprot:TRINITY_DN514_c0_g1_i1.p1 TRINITY_DN514_c0_g1~~TRINITY_DN514_c0_g1_i1.p1  ORF type:complete len:319 (+),score=78.23 TRINITY_DN514_c0_g1_i1:31-987(+)